MKEKLSLLSCGQGAFSSFPVHSRAVPISLFALFLLPCSHQRPIHLPATPWTRQGGVVPQENVVTSNDAADGYLDVAKQIKLSVKLISSTLRRTDDMVRASGA